jgi:hypothetical protein
MGRNNMTNFRSTFIFHITDISQCSRVGYTGTIKTTKSFLEIRKVFPQNTSIRNKFILVSQRLPNKVTNWLDMAFKNIGENTDFCRYKEVHYKRVPVS